MQWSEKREAIIMIKRRFYRFEHGSRDAPSESSSSSDSEVEVEAADDSEIEEEDEEVEEDDDGEDKEGEENVASDARDKGEASSSSGYESEDSSVNEVNLDSSGLPTSDDDVAAQDILSGGEINSLPTIVQNSPKKDETDLNMAECVLKRKSVFKCRLCPRIVCLSEETLKAHLSSKKHARSEKLLKEGRLKLMLNDDGEIEGEMQNPDATADSDQEAAKPNKKRKGQGKPGKRQREKKKAELGKGKPSKRKREKRRKKDN